MNNQGKIIILDYSIFVHRAIFAWRNSKQIPAEYTCLNMIMSALRKIGVEPYDTIIVACDGKGNWRKVYEKEYKANRKAFRESFEDIDWKDMFRRFDNLLNNIDSGTNWHIIRIPSIEADDIASVSCRYFKDREIILISYDKDWEMLWEYPWVKIFSVIKKHKGRKGAYKVRPCNFSGYKLLAKKINKEVSDNLVNPISTEQEYENRQLVISLLELPNFVEQAVREKLENLHKEPGDINYIPFKTIQQKIDGLYNDKKQIVTYQECVDKEKKKRKKK